MSSPAAGNGHYELFAARLVEELRDLQPSTPRAMLPGDRRDRQAEVCDAVGQVDVQPALNCVGRSREDDLVAGLVVEGLLDGIRRIVSDRYDALHGMSRRLFDERKRTREHALGFNDLVVAFGVPGVPLRRSGIRDQDAELGGAARRTPPNHVQQAGRGGDPISDDQNARRTRRSHGRERARTGLTAS